MSAIISSINATACNAVLANARVYGNKKIAQIPIELLEIAGYQRKQGKTVLSIAKEWDDNKCGPLAVSYRGGSFYVVDGQHRLAAAKLIGKLDMTCVISEMSYKEEADYFARQKENVSTLTAYQRLWANKEAGDLWANDVFRIFEDIGVPLVDGRRCCSGECCSAAVASKIYQSCGRDALVAVLHTIEAVGWKFAHNGYSSTSMSAMKNLWRKTQDEDVMILHADEVIGRRSFDVVLADAHANYPGRGGTSALSEYLSKDM